MKGIITNGPPAPGLGGRTAVRDAASVPPEITAPRNVARHLAAAARRDRLLSQRDALPSSGVTDGARGEVCKQRGSAQRQPTVRRRLRSDKTRESACGSRARKAARRPVTLPDYAQLSLATSDGLLPLLLPGLQEPPPHLPGRNNILRSSQSAIVPPWPQDSISSAASQRQLPATTTGQRSNTSQATFSQLPALRTNISSSEGRTISSRHPPADSFTSATLLLLSQGTEARSWPHLQK
ncbi:hypothetical protein GJAV_G00271170 [Gymnothorax javanicus]|nr:hypothetical protein GJAV_G00271170 [Gymnothorax javanicus]